MHKVSHLVGDDWVAHSFAPSFAIENGRIIGGVPAGDSSVFEQLVTGMAEPIILLYVLHTPRGEAVAGRYESPHLGLNEFRTFVERYGDFLARDARCDIWAHSLADDSTVVWDRHNQLFAYGPLQHFSARLSEIGFQEAPLARLGSHQHHYRPEFDLAAQALMKEYHWKFSPLKAEDEQRR